MIEGILDNWTLQEVLETMESGFNEQERECLVFDRDDGKLRATTIADATVRLESLAAFITDLLLKDKLSVESRFDSAWGDSLELRELEVQGTLCGRSLLKGRGESERIANYRHVATTIAESPELRSTWENLSRWGPAGCSGESQYFSQIFLGGASHLEASSYWKIPYTPHPLRRRGIGSAFPRLEAQGLVLAWAQNERNKYLASFETPGIRLLTVQLPLLFGAVIQECSRPSDIFLVAGQMRAQMKPLREWLSDFQNAIERESVDSLRKHQGELSALSSRFEKERKGELKGSTEISFAVGGLGMAQKIPIGNPLEKLGDLLTIRGQLQRLVMAEGGQPIVNKCLRLFDNRNESLRNQVIADLVDAK